ncbi:ferredoxin [Ruminococcaceae bacterium YRB3002]|nr:ferredoxin [Ruminococcaceae bacterium YRB3002]
MKYVVSEACIGCGMCTGTCDAVFSMSDEGVAVAIEGDVPAEEEANAAEAKEGCPVGAIEEV